MIKWTFDVSSLNPDQQIAVLDLRVKKCNTERKDDILLSISEVKDKLEHTFYVLKNPVTLIKIITK